MILALRPPRAHRPVPMVAIAIAVVGLSVAVVAGLYQVGGGSSSPGTVVTTPTRSAVQLNPAADLAVNGPPVAAPLNPAANLAVNGPPVAAPLNPAAAAAQGG